MKIIFRKGEEEILIGGSYIKLVKMEGYSFVKTGGYYNHCFKTLIYGSNTRTIFVVKQNQLIKTIKIFIHEFCHLIVDEFFQDRWSCHRFVEKYLKVL